MKIIIVALLVSVALLVPSKDLFAQSQGYHAGPGQRIDLEGRHRIVDHAPPPPAAYRSGPVARIDLEGRHRIVDHTPPPAAVYKSGPVARIDLEGRHRLPKSK